MIELKSAAGFRAVVKTSGGEVDLRIREVNFNTDGTLDNAAITLQVERARPKKDGTPGNLWTLSTAFGYPVRYSGFGKKGTDREDVIRTQGWRATTGGSGTHYLQPDRAWHGSDALWAPVIVELNKTVLSDVIALLDTHPEWFKRASDAELDDAIRRVEVQLASANASVAAAIRKRFVLNEMKDGKRTPERVDAIVAGYWSPE